MSGVVTISITQTPDLPGRWVDLPDDEALVVLRVLEQKHFAAQKYLARMGPKYGKPLPKTPLATKYRRLERAFYLAMRALQKQRFWHAESGECAICGGTCRSTT